MTQVIFMESQDKFSIGSTCKHHFHEPEPTLIRSLSESRVASISFAFGTHATAPDEPGTMVTGKP